MVSLLQLPVDIESVTPPGSRCFFRIFQTDFWFIFIATFPWMMDVKKFSGVACKASETPVFEVLVRVFRLSEVKSK
jgi:hypothetical protein